MSLTAEQQVARLAGIGGSDCAAVCGVHPWKSPFTLYLEKRGECPPDERESEAMFWGSVLEEPVARRYAEVTGRKIRRQPMRVSGIYPFMLANVDRQVVNDPRGPGVLEVKTANAFKRVGGVEELDDHYYLQLQHYLAVTGYEWGSFAFLIGGQQFRHFDVERDNETISVLIECEREFWRRVELGDPPPVDGSDATRALLARMYGHDSGSSITVQDPDLVDAAHCLVAAKEKIKAHEADIQLIENRFKSLMESAAVCVIPGFGELTWKTAKPSVREKCDVARLRNEWPSAYAACVTSETVAGSRRFLVKPAKP